MQSTDAKTDEGTEIKEITKTTFKEKFNKLRKSPLVNILFTFLIPLITTITLEWIARGTLGQNKYGDGFFISFIKHFPSFLISYLLLLAVYIFISQITKLHALATAVVWLAGNIPALVTYINLTMRGEPFLPWDISQISDLLAVKSNVALEFPVNSIITLALFIVLVVAAAFVRIPPQQTPHKRFIGRMIKSGVSLAFAFILMFGIFLNPAGTRFVGIYSDMWMQDRYYRTNGVITGFLTNLQLLNIEKPEGYSSDAVQAIADEVLANAKNDTPLYSTSYAAQGGEVVEQPDIIFLMGESFWDVTSLEGIEYDQPILPNLTALSEEAARGYVYSPSFGGGTCDVEFEALTGFSMENLPAGSKPYQQYVTEPMFSLPQYLKSTGYDTLAIHGYGGRFWNREQAYPRLGINDFISSEDFVNPDKKRGFISDDAMVDRIIEEYEDRAEDGPMFIHAVTMQNHTTYDRKRYPEDQLVNIVSAPDSLSDSTIGQLEDCATGIRDMDAAVGELTEYLSTSDRPTIVVVWGDHLNPMSDGYKLFEETGFIDEGDTASPNLRQTPLLIWSNYSTEAVDLGTVASYNITPVMMDLFGLEKPLMFEFLAQQMEVTHAQTKGVTVNTDNTFSTEMTEEQEAFFKQHSILQYDFMFGSKCQEDYTPDS
ncbi:MAG: LTA synthase family protein [Oscillospiraceae bacterium]